MIEESKVEGAARRVQTRSVGGAPYVDDPRDEARAKAMVIAGLVPSSASEASPGESPKIGRFSILRRVGQGGMGVVYAVYDEQLDRRVALKLIKDADARPELRARLVREARGMAKLTHPNVVPVFEVGEHEGEPYIVMEYVKGRTLRQWLKEAPRSAEEILDKFMQAGRGLAAAHELDLVHRDFKPDNVIVGDEGRVRVLDFGLVRRRSETKEDVVGTETELPSPQDDAFDTPLTSVGGTMGTPAYMAPEQFLGEETDARTDQFSFCVALWEALCGERPFAGKKKTELVAHVTAGRMRSPPHDAKLPKWVRPVIERGLSMEPGARWPSMTSLPQRRLCPRNICARGRTTSA